MTTSQRLVLIVLIAGLCCGRERVTSRDVVAQIEGADIRYHQFEGFLSDSLGEKGAGLDSAVLTALFDQFLVEELLLRLAVDRGVIAAGDDRHQAVEGLLAGAFADGLTDEDVAAYYAAHAEEFYEPERVRLRQILVEDRETAERVLEELAGGAEFGDVARRFSQDPSAPMGGHQGELAQEDLPPAFAEAIFKLEPGRVSEVLPADYGFHIFQVVERLPSEVVPLAEADNQIRRKLRTELADKLLEDLVEEAKEGYSVRVFQGNLPFDYNGSYAS